MILFKSHSKSKETIINDKIKKWSESLNKGSILNVISAPYSDCDIFLSGVLDLLYKKKKVLYITNEDENNITFLKNLKKKSNFRNYAYFRNKGRIDENTTLIFSNHINAYDITDNFDLAIYDDVSCYNEFSKKEIQGLLLSRNSLKYICYSIEEVLKDGDVYEHSLLNTPFVEPRIINTRIDLNKDIPYMVYEYLNWFMESKRNVLIYVPDKDKVKIIEESLEKLNNNFKNLVLDLDNDYKRSLKLMKNKDVPTISIITSMYKIPKDVNNLDIIVYFADNVFFNYKKLIFICGKAGVVSSPSLGEVIFLGNTTTEDMITAKDITRGFNKLAWESGLLRI